MRPAELAAVLDAYRVLEAAARVPERTRHVTDPYAVRTAVNVLRRKP